MSQLFTPVVQPSISTIVGLQLYWVSVSSIAIAPGQCFDSTQSNLINQTTTNTTIPNFGPATLVNILANGLNGLDTGSVAASTFYNVFAVNDPSGYNQAGFVLSASSVPLLPKGLYPSNYSQYRRIGSVLTDGSANICTFIQSTADGVVRSMQYGTPIVVLSAGNSTIAATVSLNTAIPTISGVPFFGKVNFGTSFVPATAADTANIIIFNINIFTITGQVATIAINGNINIVPAFSSSVPVIGYKVSASGDALTIAVVGYDDIL